MAIRHYLAMTPGEIQANPRLPPNIAWMACHFSPYSLRASNLPRTLPPDSVVILDDITPICGHDPRRICEQLTDCVGRLECSAVLLDFQRPGYPEASALAQVLAEALPCPVGVSSLYAEGSSCPVFLPPVPHHKSLKDHLAPWQGREIWLDTALDAQTICLTEAGAACSPFSRERCPEEGFFDEELMCHYRSNPEEEQVVFTLWRTEEDLERLLSRGEALGVTRGFGLFQELGLPRRKQ